MLKFLMSGMKMKGFLGQDKGYGLKKKSLFLIQLNFFPLNRVKSAVIIQLKLMDLF